jgi:predicted nucleic acid-binding protein
MTVFDSNVWIALFHESDTLHSRAKKFFEEYQPPYGIPEYVLLEVATILAQKASIEHARQFIDVVFDNRDCVVWVTDEEFCRSVAHAFVSGKKAGLSFVDMSLVVLASKNTVITFDAQLARRIGSLI